MSNPQTNIKNKSISPFNPFVILASLVLLATFACILGFAYIPRLPGEIEEDIVEQRFANLAEVQAGQKKLISSYEWVDKEKGVVRIPIEQSMRIVVEELQASQRNLSDNKK